MIAQTKSTVEWRTREVKDTWSPLERMRRAADGRRRRDWFVAQFVSESKDRPAPALKLIELMVKCG